MPMSGTNTLDKLLQKAQRYQWKDYYDHKYQSGYSVRYMIVDKFAFSFNRHDTGCSLTVNIVVSKDERFGTCELYNIVNATFWYSSNYLFNKEKWESGAWDKAFEEAQKKLLDFVTKAEQAEEREKQLAIKDAEQRKADEKAKVEALFK